MTISWFRFIPGLHSSTTFTAPATDRYAKPARRLHLRSAAPAISYKHGHRPTPLVLTAPHPALI
jgi:hypothetical protein